MNSATRAAFRSLRRRVSGAGPYRPRPEREARWRLTPRFVLAVVGAEVRKGLAAQWAHPAGQIIALLIGLGAYLGLQYVLGQGELRRDLLPQTLIAIGVMWLLYYVSGVMVTGLVEEKNTGTFAQAHLTPAPPTLIILGRLATATVGGILMAAVAVGTPMLVLNVAIPMRWQGLIPFLLVLLNALAFAFLLAAMALTTPLVAQLNHLIVGLVFLLNGSLLPVALYPDWLATLARILPTTLGVEATTQTVFSGDSLADIWTGGTLPLLLIYTLGLAALGWAIYVRNYRKTLRDGRLGQY